MVELVSKTNYTEGRLQNIENHIQIIKGLSTRRKSISAFESIAALWRDPTRSIEEILDEVHAATTKIVNGKRDWQNIQDVMLATYDYLEKRQQGKIKSIDWHKEP
jgi:replicative DNA helicase